VEVQGQPSIELLHAGAAVEPPLVELHASPEPAGLELATSGVGGGAEVSARVVRSSHWGAAGAPPPAAPTLADHGGGEATLTVDRSSPGELVLEATASGASGTARALYVVRTLDALPPPGSPDRAAPSRIVGGVDPSDPILKRILTQARLPTCADTRHAADAVALLGVREPPEDSAVHLTPPYRHVAWRAHQTMSGVPPIEGTSPYSDTLAMFGQQALQWIHLHQLEYPGRERYYMTEPTDPGTAHSATEVSVKNPYTDTMERWPTPRTPRASAPGPYWGHGMHATGGGAVNLHFVVDGDVRHVTVSAYGTRSFVPEILPLDGTVRVLATAFHNDAVTFSIQQPTEASFSAHMPLDPSPGATRALVNGTAVPLGPGPSVTVLVSDIARQSGILIGDTPNGGAAGATTTKQLHEITLVVEIPVDVGDTDAYGHVRQEMSVAPWGCWPRLEGKTLVP